MASKYNVLKLAGGTVGSQIIYLIGAPILTRIYAPGDFGLLAVFASILALMNVCSSLRYELAISVPEEDDVAQQLVWLCVGLVAITTGLTALGVAFCGDQVASLLNIQGLKALLWFLPLGVLLSGVYQSLNYWAMRKSEFGLLSRAKLQKSIYGILVNFLAAPFGASGLVLGEIVRQSGGSLLILHQSKERLLWPSIKPKAFLKLLQRYGHFGTYSTFAGFVNIVGNQAPIIILASYFDSGSIGQFDLAQKFLFIPSGLISSSIVPVFFQQSIVHHRSNSLKSLVNRVSVRLFLFGILVSMLALICAPTIVPLVFGPEWEKAGVILVILLPLFLGQISVSSVSMAFIAAEKNQIDLYSQIVQASFKILPLFYFVHSGFDFESTLMAYSLGSFVGYIFYFVILKKTLCAHESMVF